MTFTVCVPLSAVAQVPVPDGYSEAMGWYRKAAEAGDPKAMFYLGLTLEQGLQGEAQPETALKWYRRSAALGYSLAEFKLGLLYQFGHAVERDAALARAWYEKAAGQGMPDAKFNLAYLLEVGEGGAADFGRAVRLYKEAARAGIAEAYLNLGNLFSRPSRENEQDMIEALKWLTLAQSKGLTEADTLAAQVRELLSPIEVRDAQVRARRWTEGLSD